LNTTSHLYSRGSAFQYKNKRMTADLVRKALDYSQTVLSKHNRKAGDTVHEHSTRVYQILKNNNVQDEITLSAAILHPIYEYSKDTKVVRELFGEEVAQIVRNYNLLSRSNVDQDTPKAFNEAFIMQAYINMAKDIRTLVIRIADRKDNLDTVFAFEKEKRIEVANKALNLYAPLAKIAGFSKISIGLEDESFKLLNPSEYYKIEQDLILNSEKYHKALTEVSALIKSLLRESNIESHISQRIKSRYGIYKKSLRGPVRDKLGLRVVVNTIEQCYAAESLLKNLFDTYEDLRDDYISKPRPSGYRSIHNTLKVEKGVDMEVQIRTHEMHQYSEFGPASHLIYKLGDKGATSLAYEKFKNYTKENELWYKELSFWKVRSGTAESFNHKAPFSKNVYAFTPKGDIVELPKGASLVDFAYSVHSSLGDKCVGGHVNQKYVSLNYLIQDGDYVEIKTTNKVNANRDWLKFAITKRAKEHIRKNLLRNLVKK